MEDKLFKNIKDIFLISKFEYDWNGNDGRPFELKHLRTFYETISRINIQPDIAPTGRQSLTLEYRYGNIWLGFELFWNKLQVHIVRYSEYSEYSGIFAMTTYCTDDKEYFAKVVNEYYNDVFVRKIYKQEIWNVDI